MYPTGEVSKEGLVLLDGLVDLMGACKSVDSTSAELRSKLLGSEAKTTRDEVKMAGNREDQPYIYECMEVVKMARQAVDSALKCVKGISKEF